MLPPPELMISRFLASDPSYNGRFLTGVTTTGIYCLPSCRARKPLPDHVRFFETESDAHAAGLRACRRCRPDDFYRDHDPDLEIIEELVGRLRRDPSRFPGAASLVTESGLSSTKLHTLFRRHYHCSPATLLRREQVDLAAKALLSTNRSAGDIAAGSGFESVSAFHENFRRLTGLAPGEYRKLRSGAEFTLHLPDDFRDEVVLASFGRDRESLSERVSGTTLTKAMFLGETPALIHVELSAGLARCRIETGARPGPEVMGRGHAAIVRMLGLASDPGELERILRRRAGLIRLIGKNTGARIPLTADFFEALLWAIVGQQVNLGFAYKLRQVVTEIAGMPMRDGFVAHPLAAAVAAIDPADLQKRQFSRSKAEYLTGAARVVASGAINPDELLRGTATAAEKTLLSIRGIGPWSCHYIMMRGCGFSDCVPLGDTGLTSGLQKFFDLSVRPGPEETARLMEQFSPFRSLATYHLWMQKGEPG